MTKKTSIQTILVLAICAVLTGCAPAGSDGGGGGGGITFGPIAFQVPADNDEIQAPVTLSASGPGISNVIFMIDLVPVANDGVAPYEYELDPLTLSEGEHGILIFAQHTSGDERVASLKIQVVRPRIPVSEILANIDALQPGEWYEIPQTEMRRVDWSKDNSPHSRGGQDGVFSNSSGAYDTKRDRLVVWGGGGDSERNEVHAFDLNTAAWLRLTDPSPWPAGGEGNAFNLVTHPDGAPVSRHSYDYLEYLPPPVDRFYVGAGAAGNGLVDPNSYLFDFDTNTWAFGPALDATGFGSHTGLAADGTIWQHGAGSAASLLEAIDVTAGTAVNHVQFGGFYDLGHTSVVDRMRNLLVAVGSGVTRVWDLSNPGVFSTILPTTGDTAVESIHGVGLVYHAATDRIIAWKGTKDIYVLDVDAATWTLVPGSGIVDPGAVNRGVFGRWRYVPSKDVFITALSVAQNVFVYRLANLP